MHAHITLVVGGAGSGKSRFAERLVALAGGAKLYIATAEAGDGDGEMAARIARHRARRDATWRTREAPRDAPAALAEAAAGETVLLDAATLWLGHHLLAGGDAEAESDRLLAALAACAAPVVVVSDEVGQGIVPADALSRRFRDAQGALNQRLAAAAGLAVLVVAGLPLTLKGALPEGAT